MKWCTIDNNYIKYLKKFDERIPNIEYGEYKFKPFFSPLFTKGNLTYVTQISSKKERHLKMKEQIDFIKIYDDKNKNLLGVVNLNYMFPVPNDKIINVSYKEIDRYRKFKSDQEKNTYIYLLKMEMKKIEEKQINLSAEKLYKIVKTNSFVSKRCLNFSLLEEKALEYGKPKELIPHYNALTGHQLSLCPGEEEKLNKVVPGFSAWICKGDIEKHKIEIKENAVPVSIKIFSLSKEENKPCIKDIIVYNVVHLNVTKELAATFKAPVKNDKQINVSKNKDMEIER